MPTRNISCTYCGVKGEIEVFDLNEGIPLSKIFKYLGNNPFSGHMHYQCPACGIVLLVNPLDVLGDEAFSGVLEDTSSASQLLVKWILGFDQARMDEMTHSH
jgi:DNA-directed RNA polymerase subunit RPC12/RpoP